MHRYLFKKRKCHGSFNKYCSFYFLMSFQEIYLQSNKITDVSYILKDDDDKPYCNDTEKTFPDHWITNLKILDLSYNSIKESFKPIHPCYDLVERGMYIISYLFYSKL